MIIHGAIFDMDGTLLDSMPKWLTVNVDYMRSMGVEPPEDLQERMLRITLVEAAELMKECGINKSPEEIRLGMNSLMDDFYRNQVRPKSGVIELMETFYRAGVKMCVASASDRDQVEEALISTGLMKYISRVFTCTELNTSKSEPDIFHAARKYMGTDIAETWVFEDARHAANTAKSAGYKVCGVYDASEPDQDMLRQISDIYVESLADFPNYLP